MQGGIVKTRKLLIVDDCLEVRNLLIDVLRSDYEIKVVETSAAALDCMQKERFDMLIADFRMPGISGEELISKVKKLGLNIVIIAITAYGSTENAAKLLKLGADDYINKPFDAKKLKHRIDKSFEFAQLRRENNALQLQLADSANLRKLLGNSEPIQKIKEKIKIVASTRATILISGESGTGKKLVASEIHSLSKRKDKPFIKLNCASIPDTLLESQLFGHEKGAFPGALEKVRGKFELADEGTLLLEEIGKMNSTVQAKLLRVLQEGEFDCIGGTAPVRVDTRVIATTSRNLKKEIAKGAFREDLFYRLNVVPIEMPPLRDRRGDIPILVDHYVKYYAKANVREPVTLTPKAIRKLCNAFWKGNVRELENHIERAVIIRSGQAINEDFFQMEKEDEGQLSMMEAVFRTGSIREMEKLMILGRLRDMNENRTRAAKSLEISVRTLRNKLHEYNVKRKPVTVQPEPEEELVPVLS
jgi:DNA-binding NtrC family response regulator